MARPRRISVSLDSSAASDHFAQPRKNTAKPAQKAGRSYRDTVRDASLLRERASVRQGVLAKVDTNRLPWGDHLGEVSGYRARTTPAVDQCHPRMKMRSEKCGDLAGAACKNSTAKLVVYPVGAFAAWSCIGHVSLAWVTRRGQRGTSYHPRRMRAAQIGLIGTLTGRLTPPGRASLVVRIAADGSCRREAVAAVRSRGGLLIDLTPAAHPLRRG